MDSASAAVPAAQLQEQDDKPIDGWVTCKDLGVGEVPGLPSPRQRVRLCHDNGWVVDTYCLRPDLPVPLVGATCRRTGEDTYWCGNGIQPLKEYQIRETPQPTPTNTATITPTSTPTLATLVPYPTPQPTKRPAPGGAGFADLFEMLLKRFSDQPITSQTNLATPTPFRPIYPTPENTQILVEPTQLVVARPEQTFTDFSFQGGQPGFNLRILPDSKNINGGKAIKINFKVGDECQFGEKRACANTYQEESGAEITFFSVHSGFGGEAQKLRHAIEGTGLDQAGLPLKQVNKNLQNLVGSRVIITQQDKEEDNLEVLAAIRLPASQVGDYISTPVRQALTFAAQSEPDLLRMIRPGESLLVVETCGWRMPGERNPHNTPSTSASIYLIIIHKSN